MIEQLDLLDLIDGETRGNGGQDQFRFATVLTCMRDAMPDAMRFIIDLWAPPDRTWGTSGEWAYRWTSSAVTAKVRKASAEEHSITWNEFAELVGDHPDRQAILDWEQSPAMPKPKWKQLYRPHELWPLGGEWHPNYIETDHAEDGWGERLESWETLLSILTDAINTAAPDAADFKLPKQEWQRPRGSCRFCREEVSVGSYTEGLNHHPMGNMCGRQQLIRNHALYAYQQLEEARKNPEEEDWKIQLLKAKYEHEAARAAEAWHGDGWKEKAAS